MSWLCDICGYENEYSEEVKTTTCLCCGEPASERKIQQAKKDLIAFQKEAERKARAEKLRQKQLLRQQRIDRIFESSKFVVKGIPVAIIVLIVFSIVWLGFSMHSKALSLSDWKQQMASNMSKVALVSDIGAYGDNLSEIRAFENTKNALTISGEIMNRNLSQQLNIIKANNNTVDGYNWSLLGKRLPYLKKNIRCGSTNFESNWDSFQFQASNNIKQLIAAIKERVGEES